jgi:tetratricopeptide (TPR) repeat protein
MQWQSRLRRWFFPTLAERALNYEARLAALNAAIALHPESPSAYVLRGELQLAVGFNDLALLDFQKALDLAEQQLATQTWGVVAQGMCDRAREGLVRASARQGR